MEAPNDEADRFVNALLHSQNSSLPHLLNLVPHGTTILIGSFNGGAHTRQSIWERVLLVYSCACARSLLGWFYVYLLKAIVVVIQLSVPRLKTMDCFLPIGTKAFPADRQ